MRHRSADRTFRLRRMLGREEYHRTKVLGNLLHLPTPLLLQVIEGIECIIRRVPLMVRDMRSRRGVTSRPAR